MKKSSDSLPPHDENSERAALGGAIQDPGLASELRPEWFYDLRHKKVAETLLKMAEANQPISTVTVSHALTEGGMSGAEAGSLVIECDNACPSSADFPHWRGILNTKLTYRRMLQIFHQFISEVWHANQNPEQRADEVLENFERKFFDLRTQLAGNSLGDVDIKAALLEKSIDYEDAFNHKKPRGLDTGFHELDGLLGGLKPGQLFVIAGGTGIGKSSFALSIAENMAIDQGVPIGYFSMEMSGQELMHRIICARARVDGTRLNNGKFTESEMKRVVDATKSIAKAPIYICDSESLTTGKLRARARRMVKNHGVKIIFVDYLGLLKPGEKCQNRYEEVGKISKALKGLSMELKLPVIAMAQLNRKSFAEKREPYLSDLRDSGEIEQDANIVALLHIDEKQNGDQPTVKVKLEKNRSGTTGVVYLTFNRALTLFENPGPAVPIVEY